MLKQRLYNINSMLKQRLYNINYNSIFVIIEWFTKYSKFIPINESHLTEDLTNIIIREVINNYGLLDEFITNRSITFALRFFIVFTAKLKVNSKLSIALYP